MATNKEILFKFINDQSQKVQSDISQQGYKRNSPYVDRQQNIIQGQPGQPTPITMRGVDKTLLGTDEYGNQQIMHPGQEYEFPGSQVTEIEYAKYGGLLNKTIKCSNCGWSWKAADGGNDVSTCHKCGEEVLIQAQLGGTKFKIPNEREQSLVIKDNIPNFQPNIGTPLTAKQIEQIRLQKLKEKQGELRTSTPESSVKHALNIATAPFTALKYKMQRGEVPDNLVQSIVNNPKSANEYDAAYLATIARALPSLGMAAQPIVQPLVAAGTTALGANAFNVAGLNAGNAITAGFATHGAMNISPDVQSWIDRPTWEKANNIGWDAIEMIPAVGPTTRTIGEGINLASETVGPGLNQINNLVNKKYIPGLKPRMLPETLTPKIEYFPNEHTSVKINLNDRKGKSFGYLGLENKKEWATDAVGNILRDGQGMPIKQTSDWLKPSMISVDDLLQGNKTQDLLYQIGVEEAQKKGLKGVLSGEQLLSPSKTAKAHERFNREIFEPKSARGREWVDQNGLTQHDLVDYNISGLTGHTNPNVINDWMANYKNINKFRPRQYYSSKDLINKPIEFIKNNPLDVTVGAISAGALGGMGYVLPQAFFGENVWNNKTDEQLHDEWEKRGQEWKKEDALNLLKQSIEIQNKNIENKFFNTEKNNKQLGGENQEAVDWTKKYVSSPKYKERITNSGYDNPDKQINKRLQNLENVNIVDTNNPQGTVYKPSRNTIETSYPADLEYYNIHKNLYPTRPNLDSIVAHELGHSETNRQNSTASLLNKYDRGQLKDRLVPEAYDDLQVYIDNYLKHDKSHHNVIPEENKSDLNSYRYDMRNQYDAGTQDFTKEHLQNSPSSFAKERLLKNYSDEDLIWLMNNIAQNNNNETQIPTAQYGGSRFIPKDERDNSRVSVDNTRVNNFNDARLFSKTARNKTQKEIDKEIIDDRNKRIDASIVANKKGNLFTDNDWRQQLADRTQATGDKFRIFPNDANSFIDDYINPGVFIGNMASGLGSAPLRAQQEDSYMPYVTSVAEPVAMGAVGKILEPYINKASKFVKGQIKKNVAIPIAKSIVNKVDDAAMQEALVKFTNNPNVSSKNIIKSESFKPTELTNADGTPVPGAKSRFIAGIAEAAEPLDNEVKKRIQELSSPEGYKRLVDQESKYLRNIGFEGDLNAQADINATARLNEMHNYTSPNKVAAEMRSFNKIGDETNIEQWSNNSNMYDNAYYQPPGLAEFADVYTLPGENPYVFNQHTPTGTINLQKPPPQLGGKIMPGEIGIGYDYKNSIPTMRHEIGHFNSRGRVMPIDIEARSLETKQFLTPNEEAQYKYFRTGSKGKEPTGFLNEARQSMLDNKLINNIYDDITPEIVQKAHTHFTNAPSYEFRLPKNATPGEEHFTSPHRIFDFMNASPENFAKLSTLFNKLPAAVPVTVAGSALGAGALQQQQFGGTTVAEQYTQITGKPWRTAHTEGLTDGTAQQNLALIERLKQQLQPLQEPVIQEEEIQIVEEPVQPAMFNEDQLHRKDLAKRVVEIAENRIKNNKYIDVPDDLVKIALSRGEFANSCIGGVCDVFKEAGVMKSVDWSNTHFAKNAKEYGFTANNGWGIKSIGNLEPGDLLQRNNRTNKDGVYYPGHSQIYLGKDAHGKYRFFDNSNKEERTYYEDDIKTLLDPARKKTEPSASIYKVNPYANDNPYNLTPEEQIRAVEKSKMIKSESTSPASYNWKIADNAKNYNTDTKRVMDKFIDFANDNDKINELVKKTGKSKEEINDSLLNVFGEFGQENNWTTSKGKGLASKLENIGESILTAFGIGKNLSVGPGQIKFNQIPADVRKSFNINSPNDLYDIEKVLPLMTALDLKDKEVLTNWGKNDTLSSKLFGWKRDKYEDGYGNVTSGGFTADELSADTDGSRLNNSVGRYSPYLRNQYSSIANNTVTTGQNDYIPFNENTQQNYVPGRFNSGNEDTMIQSYTRDPGSYPYKVESNWRNNLERNVIKNEEGAVELPEIVVGKRKLKKEMGGLLYNDKDNALPHNESIDKYLAPEQTLINFMTKMQKENGGSVPFGEYYNANIKNPRKKS